MDKCKHCGKERGQHKAGSLHCPTGGKTKIGYIHFSQTDVFEPTKSRRSPKNRFVL